MPGIHFTLGRLLAVCCLLLSVGLAHALTFPALNDRVVDEAGLLDPATQKSLSDKLAGVEAANGAQIVVVTLQSLQGVSIEEYGYQLGRAWGIGQKQRNNGVLLIVAANERRVRIEVGYGLEGELTDAVTRLIIQNSISPRLRAGDISGGIARGVDDIVQVVTGDAADFKQRAAQRRDREPEGTNLANLIILAIFLIVIFRMLRGGGGPGIRRRGGLAGPIFIPSGGSWSGGGGGSSGGGGFSGGGGSFGGGGASGDW